MVRPGTVEEVAAVVRRCAETGTAIVPQGGNTGLVGGSVPLGGEVVLSLRRFTDLSAVDEVAAQVTAGAGVTLGALQAHAAAAGLAFGVDLAARDSATVGGMVATNAGGLHLLRYGPMRAQVVGVEAVLGDGRIVRHLGGLLKDNTGYDLGGLLCGSEGTLGIVTAVRLRLVPRLTERVVALLALPSMAAAVEAVAAVHRQAPSLEAAEAFVDAGMALVESYLGVASPFADRWPVYVLLECAARVDPTDELAAAVAELGDRVGDVVVASEPTQRTRLWSYREAHTEAVSAVGVPNKLDVTLPPSRLAEFADRVLGLVPDGATCHLWGHLADGNLHVNVLGADLDDEVLTLVAELGGSISAEHGIGTLKKRWLHLNRSPEEIAAFRAIKAALDPAGILNPNVLLPD